MHFNKHGSKSSCDPKNVHSLENNHQSHVGRELLILVMQIKGFINDRCLLFLSIIGLFRYKFNSRLANVVLCKSQQDRHHAHIQKRNCHIISSSGVVSY